MSIGGLAYELRIFLDTDLVPLDFGTPDIQFSGPHQGEIDIATLGTLPLNPISRVLYHAPGGLGKVPTTRRNSTHLPSMLPTSPPALRTIASISVRSR